MQLLIILLNKIALLFVEFFGLNLGLCDTLAPETLYLLCHFISGSLYLLVTLSVIGFLRNFAQKQNL